MTDDMIPCAKADAWVAAAYDAAAQDVRDWGDLISGRENVTLEIVADIRALTPDNARAALEDMLAKARREGMLRATEIVRERWASTNAEIEAAIRAEVES